MLFLDGMMSSPVARKKVITTISETGQMDGAAG
jgi:hypothetical protein